MTDDAANRPHWTVMRAAMRLGLEVLGSDRQPIGMVQQARDDDFLVDRPGTANIYIPYAAVRSLNEGQVVLDIPASQIDAQGWAQVKDD